MSKEIAVLNIESGKLTFVVGHKTIGGIFVINNFASEDYPGYYEGQWVDPDFLGEDIASLILKSGYCGKRSNIYIGVPSAFIKIETNGVVRHFDKEKTITNTLLNELIDSGDIFSGKQNFKVIDVTASSYLLGGSYETNSPIGESTTLIQASLSYVLCEISFCNMLESIMSANGFGHTEFFFETSAVAASLLSSDEKENCAVIVDIGYVNIDFNEFKNDAVIYSTNEAFGGANIADDLAYCMESSFEEAYAFCDKINLNLDGDEGNLYSLAISGETAKFEIKDINNIVKNRLEQMAEFVTKNILALDKPLLPNAPIYMVGGGITNIRGAVKYIEKLLQRKIVTLVADVPQYDSAQYTNAISLLNFVSDYRRNTSLWSRLFS